MRVRGWDEDGKIYMKGFHIGRWNEKVREGRGVIDCKLRSGRVEGKKRKGWKCE